MIIAVSGDGVYNEVVNGVLDVSGTRHWPLSRPAGTPTITGAAPGGCLWWTRSSPLTLRAGLAVWICFG